MLSTDKQLHFFQQWNQTDKHIHAASGHGGSNEVETRDVLR